MSYARPRSLNGELCEGATDGTWKKILGPDRGGPEMAWGADAGGIDTINRSIRRELFPAHFGIADSPIKRMPDNGRPVHTPLTNADVAPDLARYLY